MTQKLTRPLKAVELFLVLGLAASVAACAPTAVEGGEGDEGTPTESVEEEGGEGGEGGEGDEGDEGAASQDLKWGNTFDNREILAEFTDKVVLPQYRQFSQETAALSQAVDAFVANPSDATLEAAKSAWTAARISWEQTETFAFGPAGALGFDGAMDSWPVNRTDIDKILASSDPVDAAAVASLEDTERGMHAIEYVMFGTEDANKPVAAFRDREKAYLQGLAKDLNNQSTALLASWTQGFEGQPAYHGVFTSAGRDGNTVYPTVFAGGQELVTGILDSLTEVGEDKLAAAFAQQDVTALESYFSQQTINDLKSNLQSAENGYLGSFPGAATRATVSLSDYVAGIDPDADSAVKAKLAEAKAALASVPLPLEKSLIDPGAKVNIESAVEAILAVKETIESKVVPLI
jgi:putative iron-regulated protein